MSQCETARKILLIEQTCKGYTKIYRNFSTVDFMWFWSNHKLCKVNMHAAEKTEEAIKNGQHIDTGNIGHKTQNDDKPSKNHNTEN